MRYSVHLNLLYALPVLPSLLCASFVILRASFITERRSNKITRDGKEIALASVASLTGVKTRERCHPQERPGNQCPAAINVLIAIEKIKGVINVIRAILAPIKIRAGERRFYREVT